MEKTPPCHLRKTRLPWISPRPCSLLSLIQSPITTLTPARELPICASSLRAAPASSDRISVTGFWWGGTASSPSITSSPAARATFSTWLAATTFCSSSTTSPTTSMWTAARRGAALCLAGQPVADRRHQLSAAPHPDAEGRRSRHAQCPRCGQGQGRTLPAGFHLRNLRRPAGAPAKRKLLGPCGPGGPALRLRRGQALRRGHHHGLSPRTRRGYAHRAHL